MLSSSGAAAARSSEKILDPVSCLPKKGTKYAREREEVYLADLGGTALSESFRDFVNLQIAWFNNNQLTQLNNLENCFRIRDLYIQNNRIVTLNFLPMFKFIRTLMASGNQIKNLDKQILMIKRANYLNKLDLFDNAVADEPDYRLRMIYHVPQVEILDRLGVTDEQRRRADEVVPNMDKVAPNPPLKAPKQAYTFTQMEKDCFRTAKAIRLGRQREEEESLRTQVFSKGISEDTPFPECRTGKLTRSRWSSPSLLVQQEHAAPTPWEKQWHHDSHKSMGSQIAELAGKEELNKEDVTNLCRQLHEDGLEDAGRYLTRPDVFAPLPVKLDQSLTNWKTRRKEEPQSPAKTAVHPLEKMMLDPDATMPTKEVVNYLLTLEWHRLSDEELDRRIAEHYREAKMATLRATFGVNQISFGQEGDEEIYKKCRDKATRLEGIKTRKAEVGLLAKPAEGVLKKSRSDVFSQKFFKPLRCVDEATGRKYIQVVQSSKTSVIKDHTGALGALS